MIDVENAVYSDIKAVLGATKSGTNDIATPPSYPYVSVVQKDNPTYEKTVTSGNVENHVNPMIQIDVYSNVSKTEAKRICGQVDGVMQEDGFTRTFGYQPVENGPTKWRYTARYSGVVSRGAESGTFIVNSK